MRIEISGYKLIDEKKNYSWGWIGRLLRHKPVSFEYLVALKTETKLRPGSLLLLNTNIKMIVLSTGYARTVKPINNFPNPRYCLIITKSWSKLKEYER